VLAPEHPLVSRIASLTQLSAVKAYVNEAKNKSDLARAELQKEKTGVFTGAYAINPASDKKVPIWVADYVLSTYGTGAIMAVPGHDERDHAFAVAFDLPIIEVVKGGEKLPFIEEGVAVNSQFLDGLPTAKAKAAMTDWLTQKQLGVKRVQYRLRDWLFSRQRYWGEPFPIVHLEDGTIATIPEAQLPVSLPPIDEYRPTEDGKPPLARAQDSWLRVTMPDGRRGIREVNTMPQWAGSCWYYLRYIDAHNSSEPWSRELEKYWMPVDLYIGGVEHAVLHLLYARFWHKVLYDCGLVSTVEPFQKLFNQGMILAYSHQDERGKYYHAHEVEERDGKTTVKATGEAVKSQIEKMSKSRFNVVSPDEVINEHGADAMRLYELFMGPLEQVKPWQMSGVAGISRFLDRVWRLVVDNDKLCDEPEEFDVNLQRILHRTIEKVQNDTLGLRFNTAISQMMTFVNEATSAKKVSKAVIKKFLMLLSPYAPHLAEELWARLGQKEFLCQQTWPAFDSALLVDDIVAYAVQVNGKLKAEIRVPISSVESDVRTAAENDEKVKGALHGKTVRKFVFVPKRLVNFVVS
jgi:leucyl-tRNA synthetase